MEKDTKTKDVENLENTKPEYVNEFIKVKKITTSTLFRASSLIKKMNIADEISKTKDEMYDRIIKAKSAGVEFTPYELKKIEEDTNNSLMILIISNLEKVEEEAYNFISHITNLSPEQVADLSIEDWIYIFKLFKKQINVLDFLKRAVQ